jgi:hypothetical protein
MTVTLTNLIDEILMNLAGYTYQQDRSTYLTAGITASTVQLPLASSENVGKGIVEIGDELLWVDNFNRLANTADIPPYGRGYLGTTAAVAAIYSKVTISPTFPRFAIKRAINDTIIAIGGQLPVIKKTTLVSNAVVNTYSLGVSTAKSILSLTYEEIGPSKEWRNIRTWRFDANANSAAFEGFQTVTIKDAIQPGRTIQVVYLGKPTQLNASTDVFETVTGYAESVKDVIIYGAIYRLLAFLDPAKAAMVSPQADETDSKRPFGSSGSTTKQIYALFQQRLNEEIKNQQFSNSVRTHYQG